MISTLAREVAVFERFTEESRRSLFFARYKTTERDGDSISSEDLLAGIILGAPELIRRLAATRPDELGSTETGDQFLDRVRQDDENWRVRSSRELPFSGAAKQVILAAVQEADALGHRHVCPEHLILALLLATDTGTYQRLLRAGVTPESLQHQAKQRAREEE